jgi:hypothetical protein
MSVELKIEISDATFQGIVAKARQIGLSPEGWTISVLEREVAIETNGTTRREPGLIRKYFGIVDLGAPTGSENESIDADLAKEYGRGL